MLSVAIFPSYKKIIKEKSQLSECLYLKIIKAMNKSYNVLRYVTLVSLFVRKCSTRAVRLFNCFRSNGVSPVGENNITFLRVSKEEEAYNSIDAKTGEAIVRYYLPSFS